MLHNYTKITVHLHHDCCIRIVTNSHILPDKPEEKPEVKLDTDTKVNDNRGTRIISELEIYPGGRGSGEPGPPGPVGPQGPAGLQGHSSYIPVAYYRSNCLGEPGIRTQACNYAIPHCMAFS